MEKTRITIVLMTDGMSSKHQSPIQSQAALFNIQSFRTMLYFFFLVTDFIAHPGGTFFLENHGIYKEQVMDMLKNENTQDLNSHFYFKS